MTSAISPSEKSHLELGRMEWISTSMFPLLWRLNLFITLTRWKTNNSSWFRLRIACGRTTTTAKTPKITNVSPKRTPWEKFTSSEVAWTTQISSRTSLSKRARKEVLVIWLKNWESTKVVSSLPSAQFTRSTRDRWLRWSMTLLREKRVHQVAKSLISCSTLTMVSF